MSEPDILAAIRDFYTSLPEPDPDRITRITHSPTLGPWLRARFPAATPGAPAPPWAGLLGIPLVEDPALLPGQLRIHRGETAENWVAVPPDGTGALLRLQPPPLPEFPAPADRYAPGARDDLVYRFTVSGAGGAPLPPGTTVAIEPAGEPVRADWHVRAPWWRRILRRPRG